jgi:hypothetical protein
MRKDVIFVSRANLNRRTNRSAQRARHELRQSRDLNAPPGEKETLERLESYWEDLLMANGEKVG